MNKSELINYFRNPNDLSKSSLKELNQVVKEYPYFSSARILLTKRCKTLNLPITNKLIASTSVYVTDRNLLKKYVNGDLFFIHPPVDSSEETDLTIDSSIPHDTSGSLDLMLKELQEDMENLKSSREKFAQVQSKISDKKVEEEIELPDMEAEIEAAIEKAIFAAIEKASKKKTDLETVPANTKKKEERAIIDKFIESNPSVKPLKKETKSIEDLAKLSSAWNDEVASEYLAEIYLHQGNKKRATDIYESLSLKFPEKKSYFADLISKIN